MKLLLTSAGAGNPSILQALRGLLDKPIEECTAVCIPTAGYGHPWGGPGVNAWRFVAGTSPHPMVGLGWKSVGLLELTALPSIPRKNWVPLVEGADVLIASGGDAVYLAYWMNESGLTGLLPTLGDTVWFGMSGGSMVMAPRIGELFYGWEPPTGEASHPDRTHLDQTHPDRALGVVDFSIFPHLDHPDLPTNTMAAAEKWAATLGNPAYAIDDDTAISVIGGTVEVVSEGAWRQFS